ncbi:hypothetical protein TH25_03650 [Thalassospira profundimaris]|uniref:Uncharacterized protein n=1 Tax=Thalassospira profundimaris TaxID=502049 RepID=A0A367XLL2_9PROT|nr:hypothetical protein [Thalassospira profundimaris]RCK53622.1 hypothetical protein TH25_03650 [Thalassospira profundimaris]
MTDQKQSPATEMLQTTSYENARFKRNLFAEALFVIRQNIVLSVLFVIFLVGIDQVFSETLGRDGASVTILTSAVMAGIVLFVFHGTIVSSEKYGTIKRWHGGRAVFSFAWRLLFVTLLCCLVLVLVVFAFALVAGNALTTSYFALFLCCFVVFAAVSNVLTRIGTMLPAAIEGKYASIREAFIRGKINAVETTLRILFLPCLLALISSGAMLVYMNMLLEDAALQAVHFWRMPMYIALMVISSIIRVFELALLTVILCRAYLMNEKVIADLTPDQAADPDSEASKGHSAAQTAQF